MIKVTIYGSEGCPRCELAKKLLPGAEYYPHGDLYDGRYTADKAAEIVAASNGELPIVIVESPYGGLALGPIGATRALTCEEGTCKI